MKQLKILLIFFLLGSCVPARSKLSNSMSRFVYQQSLMYTIFDIVIYSTLSKHQVNKYVNDVWNDLEYLEEELSPAGHGFVGRLNKNGFVSQEENPEIFDIVSNFITLSKSISQKSDYKFDLTVYPLVRLWGFYVQDNKKVPTTTEIHNVLKKVGMSNIIFTNNGIQLLNNATIDLGAIAKGFAVDRAIGNLTNISGITAGIVNAGGNLRVFGQKPDNTPWKVGIRNPSGDSTEEIIYLYDGEAIATSGDYEQFFEYDGKIYHHIFDPKTGTPVTHNLSSVSIVVSNSAEYTDILATTILALGKKESNQFLKKISATNSYPLFFIERIGDEEFKTECNQEWAKRKLKKEDA